MKPEEQVYRQASGGKGRTRAVWALLLPGLGCLALAAVVVACSSSPLHRRFSGPQLVRQFAQTVRPPSSETARLLNNASILRSLGRSHLAVKELEEALQRDPGNLKVVDALAQCYEDLRDYARAQTLYEAALAKNPQHTALRNNLGFSYYQSGEWQKAEASFREALKLDPANRQARNNLGLLLVRQGRQAEALALWQEREGEQVARELLAQALAAVGEKAPVQTARRSSPTPTPAVAPPASAPAAAPSASAPAATPSPAAAVPRAPVAAPQPQVQPAVAAPRPPEVIPPPASSPVKEAQATRETPASPPQAAAPSPPKPVVSGGSTAVASAAAPSPPSPAPPAAPTKTAGAGATPVASGSPAKAAPSAPPATSPPSKPAPEAAAKPEFPPGRAAAAVQVTSAGPSQKSAPPQAARNDVKSDRTAVPMPPLKATAAVKKTTPAPSARPSAALASKGPRPKTSLPKAQSASPQAAVQPAPWQREAPPSSQELLEHRLVLLNGNGCQGIARKHREWLEMEGFQVAEVGNFRDFGQERTSISYLPGARRVAKFLSRTCYPQADLKEAASLPRSAAVLVVLGRNQLAREAKVNHRLAKLRAMAAELASSAPAAVREPAGAQPHTATPSPVIAATPKAERGSPPPPPTPVSLTSAELISTRISVKNGNGTKNIARAYRALLSQQGFTVADIGNHIDFGMVQTTILYRPEAARVAQTLAARFFPRARLQEAQLADGLEVKVVLGKDLAGPSPELLAQLGP